jgi:hypothetical protein
MEYMPAIGKLQSRIRNGAPNNFQRVGTKNDWSRSRLENCFTALFLHATDLTLAFPISLGERKKHTHISLQKGVWMVINRAGAANQADDGDSAAIRRVQTPVIAKYHVTNNRPDCHCVPSGPAHFDYFTKQ